MMNDRNFIEGEILFFDKPYKWTSFDLVNKVRWMISKSLGIKKIKVGHAGTLDPLATGLMIVCTGKATKKINTFMDEDKEYVTKIKIGETTPSFDLETEIDNEFDTSHIDKDVILEALKSFEGEQLQEPPIFSAVNVKGKRAYDYAREGKEIKLNKKLINIKEIELLSFEDNLAEIRIKCSKGTYIRAIARDLGLKLKSGGHLVELRRTMIGENSISKATTIEEFKKTLDK